MVIIGPRGLKRIISSLLIIAGEISFDIEFIEADGGETFNFNGYTIKPVLGDHRINVFAYRVDIKRRGKFDVKKAEANNVPKTIWSKLQKEGETILNGIKYTSEMVLGNERKGISVTYCTDTRPKYEIVDLARKSDLFVCEGMYGDDEKLPKAIEYKHMLFSEAANMAHLAEVSELWLTHFSPSILDPAEYSSFASEIFENTVIGTDRMTKTICFDKAT
ncbi:Ribonuclease Z [bioreactor metagenome]|uniref:Ribonuclease Z n=1 Tax=bioreactor metagenome TaxID=1076179 RepID=A0A645HHY2_9ZZZZ